MRVLDDLRCGRIAELDWFAEFHGHAHRLDCCESLGVVEKGFVKKVSRFVTVGEADGDELGACSTCRVEGPRVKLVHFVASVRRTLGEHGDSFAVFHGVRDFLQDGCAAAA